MWLIPLLAASLTATAVYFSRRDYSKYLVLILWGATIMVAVDWLWSYIAEGEFIPSETFSDPVGSSLLGLVMVLAGLILWILLILVLRIRKAK
ncbi:MAG: hypothetical protein QXJ51_05015 [Sulfolobales archaeon]